MSIIILRTSQNKWKVKMFLVRRQFSADRKLITVRHVVIAVVVVYLAMILIAVVLVFRRICYVKESVHFYSRTSA